MPIVKYAVTNLSQGASQQAESQRFPSQAAEQINGYSSHIKGLVKRPPLKHLASIDVNAGSATQSFLHVTHRDADERFAVVINKGTEVDITGVGTSGEVLYSQDAHAFSVGDQVQFVMLGHSDEIPAGITQGSTYFVHSIGTVSPGNLFFTVKKLLTDSTYIKLGKTELVTQGFGDANDQYKAGLLIESIQLDSGAWIDGVITIRFDDTVGHTYDVGETINMPSDNWQGSAQYFNWGRWTPFTLFQPAKTLSLTSSGTSGQTLRANELANKFWLRHQDSWTYARAANYGLFVDGDQLFFETNAGGTGLGDKLIRKELAMSDIIGFTHKPVRFSVSANVLTKTNGTLDCTTLANGLLIKIGNAANNPRAIIISTTTTTITVAENVNLTGAVEDNSGESSYFLKYWSSVTNSQAQRYFAQNDYRTAGSIVKFGDAGGTCTVYGGSKGAGPYVFDLDTGAKYEVEVDDRLGINPYKYLLNISDPSQDIKAKTIGDTTFLINKTIATRESAWSANYRRYEAFITVRQADYAKYYKIKIGTDAIEAAQPEIGETTATKSHTSLYGATVASQTYNNCDKATSRPICRIQHTIAGVGNSTLIRLMQNFQFGYGVTMGGSDRPNAVFASWGTDSKSLMPNAEGGGFLESSKQDLRRAEMGIELNKWQQEKGAYQQAHQDTDRVALYYNPTESQIFLWINFYWGDNNNKDNTKNPFNNLTTVRDLQTFFQNNAVGDDWEILLCDADGLISTDDDYDSGTVSTLDDIFLDQELGSQEAAEEQEYHGRVRTVYPYEGDDYSWGLDFIVRETGYRFVEVGWFEEFMKIGLQNPDCPTHRFLDENRDRTSTDGASGTGTQTGLITGGTTDDDSSAKFYDGEFFYRSPKWTGDKNQTAVGTDRIAEMLASNMYINNGQYLVHGSGAGATLKRADGRAVTFYQKLEVTSPVGGGRKDQREEGIGLTYNAADLAAYAGTNPQTHQDKNSILQKISDNTKRVGLFGKDWHVEQKGSTIALRTFSPTTKFDISVSDDLGGNGLELTYFEVDEAAKLPEICRHGHIVKVVGNAREEADDYYLEFVADNQDPQFLSHGRWKECAGFNIPAAINPRSLPVILTRHFRPNGTKFFKIGHRAFNERKAGDKNTNPMPSFVGKPLTDIFLFKNRLGFIANREVCMSESGEFFNFFRRTVAALLDSAPINVSAASERVAKISSALTYSERLLLFSDNQQFALQGDAYLSPKTVNITPTTDFNTSTTCTPILAGSSVFFTFPRTGFGGVSEYFLSKDQVDSMDAKDVTAHIPKYIKGNIIKMTTCSSEDVLVVLTDHATVAGEKARLYIYKYYLADNNQKVQSAWFTYETGDQYSQFLSIDFLGNKLYAVIKRGNEVYIESLLFEDAQLDTGRDYQILLDRRIIKASGSSDVVFATGNTTITLPYVPSTAFTVMKADNSPLTATSVTSTTAVFNGVDLTGQELIMGEPYTMTYELSRPFLRKKLQGDSKGTLLGGRHQLARGTLEFTNARSFSVAVTHQPQNVSVSSSHNFNGVELGYASGMEGSSVLSQGFYTLGIQGKNDKVDITLSNATPYPSDFLSIDYEGRAYSRGTRWG